MVVPRRVEAAAALLRLDPPRWLIRHSRGVAEVAAFLASRARRAGHPIDVHLVEAAALLHDVDKALPSGDPARRLPHGRGSADWLAREGYPELGPAAAGHPVTRLLEGIDGPSDGSSLETRIVAYADKRVAQRLVPLGARFAGWRRRYPGSWRSAEGRRAESLARALEREVCAAAGITPGAVSRLRWVGRALNAAHAAATDTRTHTRRAG